VGSCALGLFGFVRLMAAGWEGRSARGMVICLAININFTQMDVVDVEWLMMAVVEEGNGKVNPIL
jgi:hypothetical protein